jgi:hypothetical protein
MTLSVEELRIQHKAMLELLITDIMAARRIGNDDQINASLEAIADFRLDTPFLELQKRAKEAREVATHQIREAALNELAEIAARLGSAGETFKSASHIAATGRKDLLFPRLAATASQTLETFSQLETAVKAVEENVESAEELGDIPDAFKAAKNALEDLKGKVKQFNTG